MSSSPLLDIAVVDADSFAAHIKVTNADLKEGEPVEVLCQLEAQNLPKLFFSVAWFKGEEELARLGPLGVLTIGPGYKGRATEGELRAVKTTEKDYTLTLRPVRAEDQGEYQCRVWQEQRGDSGGFTQGQSKRSSTQQVTITATGETHCHMCSSAVCCTCTCVLQMLS